MAGPFTTPVAQSTPFEPNRNPDYNGNVGALSADNVQDAIEEAYNNAPGKIARYTITLTHNGAVGNGTFFGYSNLIPGDASPILFPFASTLTEFTFTNKKNKNISFYVFYATVLGLIINYIVTIFYFHPRPFMINQGTQLINHSIGTSLPSDHTTILLSIAIMLIYFKNTKKLGIILTIFGLLGGISRIFCGVHFPLDIIASIFVALISTYTIYKLIPKLEKVNKFLLKTGVPCLCIVFEKIL